MMRVLRLVLLALLAIYPMIVIATAVLGGIALSQDSVSYLSTARSLGAGAGLVAFDGQPLTLFPPGLPILLGLGEVLGFSATGLGALLNVLFAGMIVIGTYALGRLVLRNDGWAIAASAAVSLSAAFIGVSFWLWSEPLFTVLVLGVLLLIAVGTGQVGAPWWLVIVTGVLVAAAETVRYVGYVLVPVVMLGLWWASTGLAQRSRWLRLGVVTALSVVAPIVMAARNISLGHGPVGDRYPGVRTIQDAIVQAVTVLGEFVLPPGSSTVATLAGVLIAVVIAVALWGAWIRRDRAALLVGLFAVLYVLANVWSQAATRLDSPSARLLSPALPALAVLAALGLRSIVDRVVSDVGEWAEASDNPNVRRKGQRWAVGALTVVAVVGVVGWLVMSVRAEQRMLTSAQDGSLGLERAAEMSPLVGAAEALPEAAGIASNDPWTLYLGLGRIPSPPLPPSAAEWPVERIDRDREALVQDVLSGRVTYAVVATGGSAIAPLSDLTSAGVDATLVSDLPDVRVYRLTAVGR